MYVAGLRVDLHGSRPFSLCGLLPPLKNFLNYLLQLYWYKDKSTHVIYENILKFLFILSGFKIKFNLFLWAS